MYQLSLKQIEIFLRVAACGNVSKASQQLFVAQPTVSKWIHQLEKDMGTPLFHRHVSGVTLTEAGQLLYELWCPLMEGLEQSLWTFHEKFPKPQEELRIGCLAGDRYQSLLQTILKDFAQENPDTTVSIAVHGFKELREGLLSGQLDCVLSLTFDLDDQKGISYHPIEVHTVYIALSEHHPLSNRPNLQLSDLKDEVFYVLSAEESSEAGKQIIRACKGAGFTPKELRYVPNILSMAVAIARGDGVTISGQEIAQVNERAIKLFEWKGDESHAYTTIAWRTGCKPTALTRVLGRLS